MATATVHIAAADLKLSGSYEQLGDVLYLSAPSDDKSVAVQETPEGHAVRLDADGHITHITAINAKWFSIVTRTSRHTSRRTAAETHPS